MSVFAAARDIKYAGLVLTLAFETLGDLEMDTRSLTSAETAALLATGAIAGIACGQKGMSTEELGTLWASFQAWWQQDQTTEQDAANTMMAAAQTLRENWKGTPDQTRDFLKGMIELALGDEEITNLEKGSLFMVAEVMGVSHELLEVVNEMGDR